MDRAVVEVEARVLERRLARPGHRRGSFGVGADLSVGLLRDEVLVQQFLVAPFLRAGLTACRHAAAEGRGSMRNRTSPFLTGAPSLKLTSMICPSTRAFSATLE